RRPRRIALDRARCVGQVSNVAFFRGDSQNLAVGFEHGPDSGWRDCIGMDLAGDVLKMTADLGHVSGDCYVDGVVFAAVQIVKPDRSELVIDYGAGAGRRRLDVEAAAWDRLSDSLAGRVVVVECDRPAAVRQEIHSVADPHRIKVIGVLARYLFNTR